MKSRLNSIKAYLVGFGSVLELLPLFHHSNYSLVSEHKSDAASLEDDWWCIGEYIWSAAEHLQNDRTNDHNVIRDIH